MSSVFTVKPGDSITFGPVRAETPSDISTFLSSRGWSRNMDDTWQLGPKNRYDMSWEQAVAVEFYEFITVGGVR